MNRKYSAVKFNFSMKMEGLTVIHVNIRSLYNNLSKIKDYLQQPQQKFTIIVISEAWLGVEKYLKDGLECCEMFWQNRDNKRRGSAALFVMSAFKCKMIRDMT